MSHYLIGQGFVWCIGLPVVLLVWVYSMPVEDGKKASFFDKLGLLCGNLVSNNNTRLFGLYWLTVLAVISAVLAGLGEPMLDSKLNSAEEVVKQTVKEHNKDGRLSTIFSQYSGGGKNYQASSSVPVAPAVVPAPRAGQESASQTGHYSRLMSWLRYEDQPHYASWWHIFFAMMLFCLSVIYTPIATREEMFGALRVAIDSWRSKTVSAETETGSVQPEAPSASSKALGFVKDFGLAYIAAFVEDLFSSFRGGR